MFEEMQGYRMHSGLVQETFAISRNRLRYWETKGIIKPILRQHGCQVWREYDAETLERIRKIIDQLANGMTLQGAVDVVGALEPSAGPDAEAKDP